MFEQLQTNEQDDFSRSGSVLSLFLATVLLAVAAVTTALILPFEGWRNAVSLIMIWIMALSGLFSAWLYWRKQVILGTWIIIFAFWAGALVLVSVTEGFGLILGVGAFIVASSIAAQVFPARQINQVMAVGVLVGGAAFVRDIFGPAGRLTGPLKL